MTEFICRESKEGVILAVEEGVRVAPWGAKRPRFTIAADQVETFAEAVAGDARRKLKTTTGWIVVQPALRTVAITWPEGKITLDSDQKAVFLDAFRSTAA